MTALELTPTAPPLKITWEILPEDFILPDDPVDNNLQPLLAAALRESLELAGLILESMLIATNFGLCATVEDKTVVKAPDWVYIKDTQPLAAGLARRSYTPNREGSLPSIVMEFISETEGSEYSINPHYPYGKWYFYERILQIPVYVIFHPQTAALDVYRLLNGKYERCLPDELQRYWIEEIQLFLGVWVGKKAEITHNWLRWWDSYGNLLLWGTERLELEAQKLAQEKQRAEAEKQRAEAEKQRAEAEKQRAETLTQELEEERQANQRLLELLRGLGRDL
jgi:hypothetical protein